MSKFNKVLREWRPKSRASYQTKSDTLSIDSDYTDFTFPATVSKRIPTDIDNPADPLFFAIGEVDFTVTHTPAEYDRGYVVPGTGTMDFEIDDIRLYKVEYVNKDNGVSVIKREDLTKEEIDFAEGVLAKAAERIDQGMDYDDYFDNEDDIRADYLRDLER